jgi:ribonuclease H / adenosylcobalamin/alpha-ribazole phosphatase
MASSVHLVRHGQTASSAARLYSGRVDIPLNATGRGQARRAAERLAHAGIDAVFTSPLVRARDTAEAIAGATGAPLTIDARLTEVDYGAFEGLDRAQARAKLGAAFDAWRADPFGATLPGTEPLGTALERARDATADVLAAAERPVIVGHQGILRIVLIALGELAPGDYFTRHIDEAEPIVVQCPQID